MQDGRRVGGPRLVVDGHEDAAAAGQRFEDARVVGLEADAAHRARHAERIQVAAAPLQHGHERAASDERTDGGRVEAFAARAERPLDQRRRVGALLRHHGQRLVGEARALQRVEPFGRPRHVLKHAHGENAGTRVTHGRNLSCENAAAATPERAVRFGSRVMIECDVAVIGAGPAGAWAAHTLARGGARVAMFDASHPREKPCGGGVTGRALALVDDALRGTLVPRRVIRTARFIDSLRGDEAVVSLDDARAPDASLVVASRTAFDTALLDAAQRAGAILARHRVTDIAVNRDTVSLRTA